MMKYHTIVADPPWRYGAPAKFNVGTGRSSRLAPLPYPTLPVAEIEALPVEALADDDCRLFLWTTNTHLPFAFSVIKAWGFFYRQTIVWHKTKSTPLGSIGPNRAEFLLVARRGSPATLKRLSDVVIRCAPGAHSTKPDVFLDLVEQVSPGPYLEMFSRRTRLGWDTWGDEALHGTEMLR